MPQWLESAVFYEIYPQSFFDTNGDGIGDIPGITEKLDYVRALGANALWINPCFDSPFKDAGYDVRDYKKVASRYGTNADLKRLFKTAHKKGIRVLLDLVPGHTSEEHAWFVKSKTAAPNEYSGRYIWSDNWVFWENDGVRFIAGEAERNGVYIINFFKCQPALNYGFLNPQKAWQRAPEHPDCRATVEALKDIMRFWLDAGCDGFRVDMADSLVKFDDGQKSATSRIWREVREMFDKDYPEAVLVSEWSSPPLSLKAGFHADFALDHNGSGYHNLVREYTLDEAGRPVRNTSYFKKQGGGTIYRFLAQYRDWYEKTKNDGYISLITGNHDTPRISFGLDERELALAYAFIFTFPGVPFLYYGDEIGMRYLPHIPTKEGGYTRTGSRTPMQWNAAGGRGAAKNMGFSAAAASKLYLPTDASPSAPNVAAQEADSRSLLNTVKALLRLRAAHPPLQAAANLEILYAPEGEHSGMRQFVYKRGNFVIAFNPSGESAEIPGLPLDAGAGTSAPELVFAIGKAALKDAASLRGGFSLGSQCCALWRIA